MERSEHGHFIVNHSINPWHDQGGVQCDGEVRAMKPSEIWKEIKPRIGEMLVAVNDIETRAEKVQEEAYQNGLSDAWEAARKVTQARKYGGYGDCLGDVFGRTDTSWDVFDYCASEAIEKIRQYEQKQEMDGLRQNIQTIVDQCGYTLDEIAEVLQKMKES